MLYDKGNQTNINKNNIKLQENFHGKLYFKSRVDATAEFSFFYRKQGITLHTYIEKTKQY